ncbi:MAG: hypothetical protein SVV03_01000 [Candidatus Nanohaloarchaea archaeon]|nr:hypothetical protein [Candidatus Nanohaloarchaea archaeon]
MSEPDVRGGVCRYCKGNFSKRGITKHIKACDERNNDINIRSESEGQPIFLLRLQSQFRPMYWMFLDIKAKTTLEDIDQFLRDKWLECCGHLSKFEIKDNVFESHPGPDPRTGEERPSMDVKVGELFEPGLPIYYTYDYGSYTKLGIEVIEKYSGHMHKDIRLAAQNLEPGFECENCGEPATEVLATGTNPQLETYCKDCMEASERKNLKFHPLCNSPRTGICGYIGETEE